MCFRSWKKFERNLGLTLTGCFGQTVALVDWGSDSSMFLSERQGKWIGELVFINWKGSIECSSLLRGWASPFKNG